MGAALNDDTIIYQSISELAAQLAAGSLTAVALVERYQARIAAYDHLTRAVVELNPDALALAAESDQARSQGQTRGPLHGIPIIIKDNIDTADQMQTTAGSLALLGQPAQQNAGVVTKLRAAGAIILGKANLSEWANYRSLRSSSGWSGRGRQTRNPYALDRTPLGSSSGSGVVTAAGYAAAALGTETNGSIVAPAAANGIVGIKPTVGLTSRAGVIPIAHSQDTVGPMARTVADAAIVLTAIAGPDPRDPATSASATQQHDYTQYLDRDGLRGARIGIARQRYFGYSEHTDQIIETAIALMRQAGAIIVDPADIPTAEAIANHPPIVLSYEFKAGLNAYLATRTGLSIQTLADLIAYNRAHADQEMPYFQQELFLAAEEKGPLTTPEYLEALATGQRLARAEGIDAALNAHQLDALLAPTAAPAFTIDQLTGGRILGGSSTPAALAGYPLITLPAGYSYGLPVNLTLMGTAYSEPTLIRLAYAFEQLAQIWQPPRFLPTLDLP